MKLIKEDYKEEEGKFQAIKMSDYNSKTGEYSNERHFVSWCAKGMNFSMRTINLIKFEGEKGDITSLLVYLLNNNKLEEALARILKEEWYKVKE